jgi:hypothetical protein
MGHGGTILIPRSPHGESNITTAIKSKEDEIGGACSMHERDEKCMKFGDFDSRMYSYYLLSVSNRKKCPVFCHVTIISIRNIFYTSRQQSDVIRKWKTHFELLSKTACFTDLVVYILLVSCAFYPKRGSNTTDPVYERSKVFTAVKIQV